MPETGQRVDPFVAFRFEIRFTGGGPVGGFSECSGLAVETQVQDYAEGGLNTHNHKFPTRTVQSNVTLKRGIVDRTVWDWYQALVDGKVARSTIAIIAYDTGGKSPVVEYTLKQAFPCKWTGPSLSATQTAIATESLEICHEGLERTR